MFIRKAFYWWLFPSAVVLPAWLLVGWAAFHTGSGWSFLGLLLCPLLFLALLAIGGVLVARKSVRDVQAVSWYDVGLLAPWNAAIVAFGFFPGAAAGWLAVAGVILFLGLFWLGLWELIAELRGRVRETYAAYERAAQSQQVRRDPRMSAGDAEVIVIEERREE
ncbi:heat shock protein [Leifsonia xyli subsp. cynodontis DSM 46306]|uniref:Uncharacterized protein n=1 Tax=Leifsonia xyli subsp. cynodontis DSM 46306 TaxID=1389489 RepID=U3P879_LEIXC|nr:hypothetical protein [Leifsonia xyli]AGW41142.1 heat shock protein [Leifsonia xyli subsp. cynodontis DSM 46306]